MYYRLLTTYTYAISLHLFVKKQGIVSIEDLAKLVKGGAKVLPLE